MDGSWEYYAKWNKSVRKKLRTIWFHSFVGYKTETHRHRQTTAWWLPEGRGWEANKRVKGASSMVTEDNLTLGGGHTMQFMDHIS